MKTYVRVILTIIELVVGKFLATYLSNQGTLVTGEIAAHQLENRDMSGELATMSTITYLPDVLGVVLVVLLIATWWAPLKKLFRSINDNSSGGNSLKLLAAMLIGGIFLFNNSAYAYYSTSDYAEWVAIGPNETAFLIPVEGANRDTQTQFDSAAYLDKKKVAAKRIQIPHMKQANTSLVRDYYVPSAVLIKLDRSFVSRTFKGPNPSDPCGKDSQCFSFESKEGINMHVGIAVTAWIPEEKAAQYLYRHGVAKSTLTGDDATYASVFNARPLTEVVDSNVHNEIQALLSNEFGKYAFTEAVANKVVIMEAIRTEITKRFGDAGIEITSIGYATPLVFDPAIQAALNSVVAAQSEAAAAAAIRPVLDVKDRQASIAVKLAWAEAIKNDKLPKLPSFMILPASASKWLDDMWASFSK